MNAIYVPESKLDLNQRQVYDLKSNASFIVQGCAGSGKTSLAMLRMQQKLIEYKGSEETKFYYITSIRELVECIRREVHSIEQLRNLVQYDDFLITHWSWEHKEITGWMKSYFKIQARSLSINAKPDYLLVDECQDLEINQIQNLVDSAQNGIAFYGDNAQRILEWSANGQKRSPIKLEDIQKRYPDKFKRIYPLLRNYRLPKTIALFAQEIGGRKDLADHCKSSYNEKPVLIGVQSQGEMIDYMVKRIRNLELYDVAIIAPSNEKVKSIYSEMARQLGSGVVSASWDINDKKGPDQKVSRNRVIGVDYSYLKETPVRIMTYEKVKGQQFETVFLLVDSEMNASQVARFYVGITRAERFLYVLYTNLMPACLKQIPLELYATTDDTVKNSEGRYHPSEGNINCAKANRDSAMDEEAF